MRRLLFGAALLLASCIPALAQQCIPVDSAQLIAEGTEHAKAHPGESWALVGDKATAFAKDVGVDDVKMLAVFVVRQGDEFGIIVVFEHEGQETACYGKPNAAAKAAIKKHFGVVAGNTD